MNFINRKILVMRHASVQDPPDVVYSNLPGFSLSGLGRRQAEEVGHFLSTTPLQLIISSGRERTRETAEIVAKLNSGQPRLAVDDDLRDMDLGQYAGRIQLNDWKARRSFYWQKQIDGVGGMESPAQVQSRMMRAWEKWLADYPTANILFVSHAGPLTILLESLMAQALRPTSEASYGINKASVFQIKLGKPVGIRKIFEPRAKN